MPKDGVSFRYRFRMFMEGMLVPFQSAMVMSTPSGVEINIEMHPTDKIFDIKAKTHVAIEYYDFIGDVKGWHLMGEGYFSGFAKYDDATSGSRSVSIICRDFRYDIRKTPAALCYLADGDLTVGYRYGLYGLKQQSTYAVKPQDVTDKNGGQTKKNIPTYGGVLAPWYNVMAQIAGSTNATPQSVTGANNGRFFMDAFVRGVWMQSVGAAPYAEFINTRIRVDKRMFIPQNDAGFRFFNDKYMSLFGGAIVTGESEFSSVEAVIMRMGAIFQCGPYTCSTPNFIAAKDGMPDETYKFFSAETNNFGSLYMMNSCTMLPPLAFTAPPNCNILFPCMYSKISWQHDYDDDITRAYFQVDQVFGNPTGQNAEFYKMQIEVPNTLFRTSTAANPAPAIRPTNKNIKKLIKLSFPN